MRVRAHPPGCGRQRTGSSRNSDSHQDGIKKTLSRQPVGDAGIRSQRREGATAIRKREIVLLWSDSALPGKGNGMGGG